MKQKITLAVDIGCYDSIWAAANGQEMIDWSDSDSVRAAACMECFGTLDLQKHLQKMAGDVEVECLSYIPDSGDTIVIGRLANRLVKEWESADSLGDHVNSGNEIPEKNIPEKMAPEHYRIFTKVQSGRTVTCLWGETSRAVLYAVSGYMEALGIRFFSPAAYGTSIPVQTGFQLPKINRDERPSFKTRGCYSELLDDSNESFLDWLMHSHVNFVYLEQYDAPWELKKRGIQVCMGGHSILHHYFSPRMPYPYDHPYGPSDPSLDGAMSNLYPPDPYPLSQDAVRPESGKPFTYYHAHPEWYGLIDGKRSALLGMGDVEGAGDNFCTSNQDAVSELCKNITDALIGGQLAAADYLNFWMLDNGRWCQCENCVKTGNDAARLTMVVYRLNRSIQRAREEGRLKRDIYILFPAYHETLPVPDRKLPEDFDYEHCIVTCFPIERCYVHHLNDPACMETNETLYRSISAWATDLDRPYKGELFIGEYYNVGSFAAISVSFREKMTWELPLYYKMGTRHMYYMHMTAKDWGTLAPTNYLFYSMLWNVELDADQRMEEYMELYYQECKPVMKAFYEALEKGSANMKYFKHYQYLYENGTKQRLALFDRLNQGTGREEDLFPLKHMQYDSVSDDPNGGISMVAAMETYEACRRLLEQAFDCCRTEVTGQRLVEDASRFDYTLLSLRYLFHMTRLARFHWQGLTQLAEWEYGIVKQYGTRLQEITGPLDGLLHFTNYQNGLRATWAEPALDYYKKLYEKEI